MKTFGEKYMMFMVCAAIIHWFGSLASNDIAWVVPENTSGLILLIIPVWYFFVFIGTLGGIYALYWFGKELIFKQKPQNKD